LYEGETPLGVFAGQLQAHPDLSVSDLDACVDKLRCKRVSLLADIDPQCDTPSVMLERPSHENLQWVEVS
jgi:hypothetical protein